MFIKLLPQLRELLGDSTPVLLMFLLFTLCGAVRWNGCYRSSVIQIQFLQSFPSGVYRDFTTLPKRRSCCNVFCNSASVCECFIGYRLLFGSQCVYLHQRVNLRNQKNYVGVEKRPVEKTTVLWQPRNRVDIFCFCTMCKKKPCCETVLLSFCHRLTFPPNE